MNQEADGSVGFPLTVAQLHGDAIQLKSDEQSDVIENWVSDDDWLSWDFRLIRPGAFRLEIGYRLSKPEKGASLLVGIDRAEPLQIDLRKASDGDQSDFRFVTVRSNGKHTLSLQPIDLPAGQSITLTSVRMVLRGR